MEVAGNNSGGTSLKREEVSSRLTSASHRLEADLADRSRLPPQRPGLPTLTVPHWQVNNLMEPWAVKWEQKTLGATEVGGGGLPFSSLASTVTNTISEMKTHQYERRGRSKFRKSPPN